MAIDTLDNPGWTVTIELEGTALEGKPFKEINNTASETDWIRCWVKDAKFQGVGDPEKLEQIVQTFLGWAKRTSEGQP